jgi:beta-lactamase superfamily II metal-dependent hydrolase
MMRLLLAFLLCLPQAQEKGLTIVWVDVEGGAATLIATPEGECLLMDTGWPGYNDRDPERIAAAMKALGLKKVDHYLTSHWHGDHWGGVEGLAKRVPIVRFYDHGFPDASAKDVDAKLKEAYLRSGGSKSTVLKPGDTVPLKGAEVRILSAHGIVLGEEPGAPQVRRCEANPEHPAKPEDASDNARSLGFLLKYGDFEFLDMGDLTWNVEHKLVCPTNRIGVVDVYQVTHHGLSQSNHPALLKAVEPTVAVVNNGAKKGGDAATFRLLKELASLKDVWQVHRNVATKAEDNAPPEFVANDDEKCQGNVLILRAAPGGKSYVVENPAKGTKRTYASK